MRAEIQGVPKCAGTEYGALYKASLAPFVYNMSTNNKLQFDSLDIAGLLGP